MCAQYGYPYTCALVTIHGKNAFEPVRGSILLALAEAGADLSVTTKVRVLNAVKASSPGTVLPSSQKYWSLLHFAAANGYVDLARLILAHPGVDVNMRWTTVSRSLSLSFR